MTVEKNATEDERGSMPVSAWASALADRVDLRRVRGVVDIDPAGTHVVGLAALHQLVEGVHLAGDHHC